MKKSHPSKRSLVIVERRTLSLDFCFDEPDDGQKIKKMRMLDTSGNTETLTHIISANDPLDKANSTTHHRDSQAEPSLNKNLNCRVGDKEEVGAEGSDEIEAACSDIKGLKDKGEQQTEAAYKTNKGDFTQSVAAPQAASDRRRENDKFEQVTTSSLSKDKPTTAPHTKTQQAPKPIPSPAQEANTTEPANLLIHTRQCHLCVFPPTTFSELILHYAAAHNITIPKTAKYLHLQPDLDNVDDVCQMCDRKYKSRATFISHLQKMHKIQCSSAKVAPIPTSSKVPTVHENLNNKVLPATASSKSPDATSSFTAPSSDQNSATPTAPNAVQKNKKATPASNIKKNDSPTSKKAQAKSATSSSTTQNDSDAFAVKFLLEDGLLNSSVSTSPSRSPTQSLSPAEASSPAIAPQSAMQRNFVALYPDLLDPHNYCKCCKKTFSSKHVYRNHCKTAHSIPLPDPNDPNFFCYVCNLKNPDLFTYRKHMSKVHRMNGFPKMVDIKCHHCRNTFTNERKYSEHLKKVAQWEQEIQLMEKRPTPMWDEPSLHCSKCLKTFETDKSYKGHLRYFHGMSATKYYKRLQEVENDHNQSNKALDRENADKDHFFCFACRKDFFDKYQFDQHLKETHKLRLSNTSISNLKIAPSPQVFAKPLDPTLYYFMMRGVGQANSN
ncbi:uncharacterized protein ATC70_002347 [Mucor velutinosus]|uniref:C2H2-type domain-containing protein n=1 Tax=Mucor velutinosus TaxID=708070 RepID=A0AAN7HMB5_9FUNG|nr:hypothetical protein ATC70_002347 [Mucor velutinosus]